MSTWRKGGIPIDDDCLADLAAYDGEAFCECGGVRFRFTAETIQGRPDRSAHRHGTAAVLTLRQIDRPQDRGGIYLVEFADAGLLASSDCEGRQCGQLADAVDIAERAARRYVCAELFRKATDIVARDSAA